MYYCHCCLPLSFFGLYFCPTNFWDTRFRPGSPLPLSCFPPRNAAIDNTDFMDTDIPSPYVGGNSERGGWSCPKIVPWWDWQTIWFLEKFFNWRKDREIIILSQSFNITIWISRWDQWGEDWDLLTFFLVPPHLSDSRNPPRRFLIPRFQGLRSARSKSHLQREGVELVQLVSGFLFGFLEDKSQQKSGKNGAKMKITYIFQTLSHVLCRCCFADICFEYVCECFCDLSWTCEVMTCI